MNRRLSKKIKRYKNRTMQKYKNRTTQKHKNRTTQKYKNRKTRKKENTENEKFLYPLNYIPEGSHLSKEVRFLIFYILDSSYKGSRKKTSEIRLIKRVL
jgi:hypothetical protein